MIRGVRATPPIFVLRRESVGASRRPSAAADFLRRESVGALRRQRDADVFETCVSRRFEASARAVVSEGSNRRFA